VRTECVGDITVAYWLSISMCVGKFFLGSLLGCSVCGSGAVFVSVRWLCVCLVCARMSFSVRMYVVWRVVSMLLVCGVADCVVVVGIF
jgi:hypothetical protein